MIRINNAHDVVTGSKKYIEYAGLHNDTKPTDAFISTGSIFLEVDTGDVYAWDEVGENWNKICALGGGS